jgi:DNA mismatch repair protein MutS2
VERSSGGEPSRTLRPEPRPVELDMATRDVPLEVDLRGLRRDEAIQTFDRYLHDAYMAGLPSVRVIHGRGTGAVRTAVREVLVGNPLVKSFTVAGRSEGGDGATNVALAV